MSTLLHLVRKDFRHWWRTLAAWLSILVLSIAWDTKIRTLAGESRGVCGTTGPGSRRQHHLVPIRLAGRCYRIDGPSRDCVEVGA